MLGIWSVVGGLWLTLDWAFRGITTDPPAGRTGARTCLRQAGGHGGVVYCYFLLDFGGMLVCGLGDVLRGRWSLVAVDWGSGFSWGARRG